MFVVGCGAVQRQPSARTAARSRTENTATLELKVAISLAPVGRRDKGNRQGVKKADRIMAAVFSNRIR